MAIHGGRAGARKRLQCEGKCRVTFAKVRNDQSFISGRTDFSLMESCGVSAPNYQTKSLCGILIIQSQNVPANMFSTCLNKLHYVCVFVVRVCVYFFPIISASYDVITDFHSVSYALYCSEIKQINNLFDGSHQNLQLSKHQFYVPGCLMNSDRLFHISVMRVDSCFSKSFL